MNNVHSKPTKYKRSCVDPDKKWAASRASYIADLDKRPSHPPPPPPPHAHAGKLQKKHFAKKCKNK